MLKTVAIHHSFNIRLILVFIFIPLFKPSLIKLQNLCAQDMSSRPQFRLSMPGSVLTSRELPEPHGQGDANLLGAIGCLSNFPQLFER